MLWAPKVIIGVSEVIGALCLIFLLEFVILIAIIFNESIQEREFFFELIHSR